MTDQPSEVVRSTVDITAVPGGWPAPWSNVAELAGVLPGDKWTLVGGLMTQLHTIHHRIGVVRPTNDIDIVLHIETSRGVPAETAAALEALGYRLRTSSNGEIAHRFVRDGSVVDLVTGTVDVLRADHAGPGIVEPLKGRKMFAIEGGTQALRRTINARLELVPGQVTTLSVPRPFGAVILKAAAYKTDNRIKDRHLTDAAALLACIEDPFAEREDFNGSDRGRLELLDRAFREKPAIWRRIENAEARARAEDTLRILLAPTG